MRLGFCRGNDPPVGSSRRNNLSRHRAPNALSPAGWLPTAPWPTASSPSECRLLHADCPPADCPQPAASAPADCVLAGFPGVNRRVPSTRQEDGIIGHIRNSVVMWCHITSHHMCTFCPFPFVFFLLASPFWPHPLVLTFLSPWHHVYIRWPRSSRWGESSFSHTHTPTHLGMQVAAG